MTRARKYQVKTKAAFLPITLDRAKEHLKAEGITAEDALITSYIQAATEWAESYAQRAIMKQEWYVLADNWPHHSCLEIADKNPILSIDAVEYKDEEGNYQELPTSNYVPDLNGVIAKLHFINNLPSLQSNQVDRIRVTVTCGYSSSAVEATQRAAIDTRFVPAILLKVAEMHLYREDRAIKQGLSAAEYLLHPLKSSL